MGMNQCGKFLEFLCHQDKHGLGLICAGGMLFKGSHAEYLHFIVIGEEDFEKSWVLRMAIDH